MIRNKKFVSADTIKANSIISENIISENNVSASEVHEFNITNKTALIEIPIKETTKTINFNNTSYNSNNNDEYDIKTGVIIVSDLKLITYENCFNVRLMNLSVEKTPTTVNLSLLSTINSLNFSTLKQYSEVATYITFEPKQINPGLFITYSTGIDLIFIDQNNVNRADLFISGIHNEIISFKVVDAANRVVYFRFGSYTYEPTQANFQLIFKDVESIIVNPEGTNPVNFDTDMPAYIVDLNNNSATREKTVNLGDVVFYDINFEDRVAITSITSATNFTVQ